MPELPEVEGVVRAFAPEAIGRTVSDITVSDIVIESKAQGREAIIKGMSTADFIQQMKKMTIVNVTRRSKYIYMNLQKGNNDYLLVSHLGMSGAWFVVNSIDEVSELKFRRHIHVIFT
ncbi:hypothetical protein J4G37_46440, partial [Microvirga sp. 3-52]|nr:hypothetical protein [Microvirga sp. 3-52]